MKVVRFSRPVSHSALPFHGVAPRRVPAQTDGVSRFVRRCSATPTVFDPAVICGPGSTRISAADWRLPGRSPYPASGDFFLTQDELCIGPWYKPAVHYEQVNGVTKPLTPDFEFPTANLARVRVPHDSPFLMQRGTPEAYVPMLPLLEQACQFQLPMFDRFPTAAAPRRLTIFFERWEQISGMVAARPGDLLQIAARLVPEKTFFKHHLSTDQYRVDATLEIEVSLIERDGTAMTKALLTGMGIINGTTESRAMPRNIFAVSEADFKAAFDARLAVADGCDLHTTGEFVKAGRFEARNMAYAGYDTLSRTADGIIGVRYFDEKWPVFDYHFGGDVRLTPGIVFADLVLQRMALEPFLNETPGTDPLDVTAFGQYHLRSIGRADFKIPGLPGSLVGVKLLNPQTRRENGSLVIAAEKGVVFISRNATDVFNGALKCRTAAEFEHIEIEMPFIPRCEE